jgi:diguanylate cyclase (GGDEF)-like protein
MPIWPKPFHYFEHVRLFLVILCTLLSLLVAGFFLFLYLRTDRLMGERLEEQATAYYDLVTYAREWNAGYGGVYVEKRGGVEANAYLQQLGIDPDVRDVTGRVFTLRNHAIMTTEISRMSERAGGVRFRMISQTPLDPANAPDDLERGVLNRFAAGEQEFTRLVTGQPLPIFRYIRPLRVEQACLECHKSQGYAIGDVLGAVSIAIPVGTMLAENRTTKVLIIIGAVLTIGMLVALTYFLTWRLVIKLDEVQSHLKRQAATDELTGLKNRRNIMKRLDEELQRALRLKEPLCLMIIDIDHFKRINDTYGHPFGDVVLKGVAASIRETIRSYDTVGRIGGEEFLIISPGVEVDEAVGLAERVRERIGAQEIGNDELKVKVTLSIGVTTLMPGDLGVESLMKRADQALYQAKDQGRNRVVAL